MRSDASHLSLASRRCLQVLEQVSSLAWPILKTQCAHRRLDPERLMPGDLPELVPLLVSAVGRFTSPEKARKVEAELAEAGPRSRRESPWSTEPPSRPSSPGSQPRRPLVPEPRLEGSQLAQQVLEAIREFTPLAEALLDSQCERMGITPQTLGTEHLERLIPLLSRSVGRFSSPAKGELASQKLRLLQRATGPGASGMGPGASAVSGGSPQDCQP